MQLLAFHVLLPALLMKTLTARQADAKSSALTQSGANVDFLLFVLKFGKFFRVDEKESLDWKAQEREMREAGEKKTSASHCAVPS